MLNAKNETLIELGKKIFKIMENELLKTCKAGEVETIITIHDTIKKQNGKNFDEIIEALIQYFASVFCSLGFESKSKKLKKYI